jgi:hypothetical protein
LEIPKIGNGKIWKLEFSEKREIKRVIARLKFSGGILR